MNTDTPDYLEFRDLEGNKIETPLGARVPPEGPVTEGIGLREYKIEQTTDEFGNRVIRTTFTEWGRGEQGPADAEHVAYHLHSAAKKIGEMAELAALKATEGEVNIEKLDITGH
jgi:hypothetical protein